MYAVLCIHQLFLYFKVIITGNSENFTQFRKYILGSIFGNTILDGCKRDNWYLPLENVIRSFELCVLNSISHRSIIPRYIYYAWLLIYSFNLTEPLLTWWKWFKVMTICIKDFTAKRKNEKKKNMIDQGLLLIKRTSNPVIN